MPKYKNSKYKGYTIEFTRATHKLVLARVRKISRQFIGAGKNKTEALKSAKKQIDFLIRKKK